MSLGAQNWGYPKLQIVAIASLVATAIVQAAWVFSVLGTPAPEGADIASFSGKLALMAPSLSWLALLIFFNVIAVALGRLVLKNLNPLNDPQTDWVLTNNRILTNTIEQSVIYLIALFALAAVLPAEQAGLLTIAIPAFVFGRVLFWGGYLIHPAWRSFGIFWTFNLQALAIIAGIYYGA